jgi:hypothetical protein
MHPLGDTLMTESSTGSELGYHLERARCERDLAYRSGDTLAADAHMRLSVLHMNQALLLQTGRRFQTDDRSMMMDDQTGPLKLQVIQAR